MPRGAEKAVQPRLLGGGRSVLRARFSILDGKPVDALASNNGHLLWSGIVDKSKARAVARHLVGPVRLFSGRGVRTLAEGEGRFNPIGYHVANGLAVRQLVHRLGPSPVRIQGGGRPDRRGPGTPRGRRILRRTAPGKPSVAGPAGADQLSGSVPNGAQPASMVHGRAAAATANDAGPRADRGRTRSVDPALPLGTGHLELLDIPGRWARATPSDAVVWTLS